MPEIAEREPKVTSVGLVHVVASFRGGLCAARPAHVVVARRTACALGGAGSEEMVLFTPS